MKSSTNQSIETEEILWSDSPHWAVEFKTFVICGLLFFLIFPIFIALWRYLQLKSNKYELTTHRFKIRQGLFSRHTEELELYRVKDLSCSEPFLMRLFGVANLYLFTSDRTTPVILIAAIKDFKNVNETIRNQVEKLRAMRGVREMDVDS
jgi:uncharacterized membrane protein YdbT with pleckstrin-like domain